MSGRPPFVKVAEAGEIPAGTVKHVLVHDEPLARCNVDGSFYAVHAACAQMGGPLSRGTLREHVLACPWHGWTYDVRTGLANHPGGRSISSYEVRAEGGDALVGWLKRPSS